MSEKFEIRIRVNDESELYSPYDPEMMTLEPDILAYMSDKYEEKDFDKQAALIFEGTKIDKDRLKKALSIRLDGEIIKAQKQIKLNRMRQARLFLIGVLFVALGIILSQKLNAVPVEILSIIGSFAVWEAANIWIVGNPSLNIRKRFLNSMRNAEIIVKEGKIYEDNNS